MVHSAQERSIPTEQAEGSLNAYREANACLIAAAPGLLDAAKSGFLEIVGLSMALAVERNDWKWPDDAPDTVAIPAERLRAAIAKATGNGSASALGTERSEVSSNTTQGPRP